MRNPLLDFPRTTSLWTAAFAAVFAMAILSWAPPAAAGEETYRVIGVAGNDVLNVRRPAGAGGAIVGMLAPDAGGIVLSGERQVAADGGTWVEIVDHALPGGSGWVNARFLEAETEAPSGPGMGETAASMVEAEGYAALDPAHLEEALLAVVSGDPRSAFLPGADLTPLAKAVMLVQAAEGELRHARYRLSYGLAMVPAPPAADPVPLSVIQVDRFNLGPQVRAQLAGSLGEEHVAPAEEFGTGPHVSYRFAMRPLMGRTADLVAASRAELDGSQTGCLGFHCLVLQPTGDHVTDWDDAARMAPPEYQTAYEIVRDGMLSPVAALDVAAVEMAVAGSIDGRLVWRGFEPREGVEPGEPFAEAVMEVNLAGQDRSVDVLVRDGNQMDHEIAVVWRRVTSAPGGAEPLVYTASNTEPWRR